MLSAYDAKSSMHSRSFGESINAVPQGNLEIPMSQTQDIDFKESLLDICSPGYFYVSKEMY